MVNEFIIVNSDGEQVNTSEYNKMIIKEVLDKQEKQREAYKKKLEKESKASINFYNNDMEAMDLLMDKLTRGQRGMLLILCCHLCYCENGNKLMHTNGKPLTEKRMQAVLNCSRKSLTNFLKICLTNSIMHYDSSSGTYSVNPSIAFRGSYKNDNKMVVSIVADNLINAIEEGTLKASSIGFLYDIQKYLNMESMMLVENPEEHNIDKLKPLNQKELARKMGMSEQQLVSHLRKLVVKDEYLVAKVKCYGSEKNEHRLVVNPNFVFRGNHILCQKTVKQSNVIFKKLKK